ncbi:hypothetical protein [Armatimonas sp.]|uniref:hypothetical protein n=1 Tax=Armatimonas sp. TaxID=1872638 RepID=UPI002869FDFA|nr:hypothetical protein [Armatimonas sp.]
MRRQRKLLGNGRRARLLQGRHGLGLGFVGDTGTLAFAQTEAGLRVMLPAEPLSQIACALKIAAQSKRK